MAFIHPLLRASAMTASLALAAVAHAQGEPSDSGAAPTPAGASAMQVQPAEAGGAALSKTPTSMAGLRRPPVFPARTPAVPPPSRLEGLSGDSALAQAAPGSQRRAPEEDAQAKAESEKRELDQAMDRVVEHWRARAQQEGWPTSPAVQARSQG